MKPKATWLIVLAILALPDVAAVADIFRWDNGQLIPGTRGIEPGPGVRLRGSQLRYADLRGVDLSSANLEFSDLSSGDLSNSNLTSASLRFTTLSNTNFSNATVVDTNFESSDLTAANFSNATVTDANFGSSNLAATNFTNATVTGVRFQGLDLSHADFGRTNLSGASFSNSNLSDSVFADATITGVDFSGVTGFSADQFNSSANFQSGDLQGIRLAKNDLTGWSFRGKNLSHADLSGSNLTHADFSNTKITNANFDNTSDLIAKQMYVTANYQLGDLQGIHLAGNELTGWKFHEKNLSHADLSGSNLSDADFSNANITYTNLSDSNLTGADFSGANITNARFSNTSGFTPQQMNATASYQMGDLRGIGLARLDLTGWDFRGKNLSHADLSGAKLTDADFSDANIKNAHFSNARGFMPQQMNATASYQMGDLRGIGLARLDLTGWDFRGKNLSHADFSASNLTDADMSAANLTNTQLRLATLVDANLTGAEISGADLSANGLTEEQFYSTSSYQSKNLNWISLNSKVDDFLPPQVSFKLDLSGWDFRDQSLIGASFLYSEIEDADFRGADLRNATLAQFGLINSGLPIFDDRTVYNQWTNFKTFWGTDFDPKKAGLTFVPSALGDFDANDELNSGDIDLFNDWITRRSSWYPDRYHRDVLLPMFDVNQDSLVDFNDQRTWVHDLKKTWFGDVNLDGEFNSTDLASVFQAGEYEDDIAMNSGWAEGDWNGDAEFNTGDLVLAFQDGGYELGPRNEMNPVPEPSTSLFLGVFVVVTVLQRARIEQISKRRGR